MKETARTKTRRAAVKFQSLTGMRNQVCKCRLEDGFRIEREVAKKIPVSRCLTFNMVGDVGATRATLQKSQSPFMEKALL